MQRSNGDIAYWLVLCGSVWYGRASGKLRHYAPMEEKPVSSQDAQQHAIVQDKCVYRDEADVGGITENSPHFASI